ncbi:MAG: hypothetical protein ACOX88_03175 [Christensenellales bacterium]|jgi:LuxR family maltose regulon positive regulatory protein
MPSEVKFDSNIHYYTNRLRHKLKGMLTAPTTLIEAPSGYGKTTAVEDFFARRRTSDMLIFRLNEPSDGPRAFWDDFSSVIEKLDRPTGIRLFELGYPDEYNAPEIAGLLRHLRVGGQHVIIIDNLHRIISAFPRTIIASLIEHGGQGLRLVLISQPLYSHRLSAMGDQYHYIGEDDFKLTAQDISDYYKGCGMAVGIDYARRVEEKTGGWIIAIHMALQHLIETGQYEMPSRLRSLIRELAWNPLPPALKQALLLLSPFDSFIASQACYMLDTQELPGDLSILLESSDFIRYTGGKYNIHPVFLDFLRESLMELGGKIYKDCMLRAGSWFERRNDIPAAYACFYRLRDYDAILDLDLSCMHTQQIDGVPYVQTAIDVIENCPEDIMAQHLVAVLQMTGIFYYFGYYDLYESTLEQVRRLIDFVPPPENAYLWGEWTMVSLFRQIPDMAAMLPRLERAAELLEGPSMALSDLPPFFLGVTPSIFFLLHRHVGKADDHLSDLEHFMDLYTRLTGGSGAGIGTLYQAEAAYQRGGLDVSESLAYRAVYHAEAAGQDAVLLEAAVLLGLTAISRMDERGLYRAMEIMRTAAGLKPVNAPLMEKLCDYARAVLLAELGDESHIPTWIRRGETEDLPAMLRFAVEILRPRLYLNQHNFARTIAAGEPMLEKAHGISIAAEAELHLILACAHLDSDAEKAAAHMTAAAELFFPDEFYQLFARYAPLLKGSLDQFIEVHYPQLLPQIQALALQYQKSETLLIPQASVPGLTEQEMRIVQLARQGWPTLEIARHVALDESAVMDKLGSAHTKYAAWRRASFAGIIAW